MFPIQGNFRYTRHFSGPNRLDILKFEIFFVILEIMTSPEYPFFRKIFCILSTSQVNNLTSLTSFARKLLLPFPYSYLAECGFSTVNDLLLKRRNRLDITKREDLRLKLTKLVPYIKSLCRRHKAQ